MNKKPEISVTGWLAAFLWILFIIGLMSLGIDLTPRSASFFAFILVIILAFSYR